MDVDPSPTPLLAPPKKESKRLIKAAKAEKLAVARENAEAGPSKHGALPAYNPDDPAAMMIHDKIKANKMARKAEKKRLEQEAQDNFDPSTIWECVPLAESQISRIPPIWTRDGRFYITAQNTSIHVHAASPPFALKSTLHVAPEKAHTAPITSLLLSPTNDNHIVTSSEDGTVKVWDLESQGVVDTVTVADGQVLHMCVGQVGGIWEVFAVIAVKIPATKTTKKKISYQVVHFALSSSTPTSETQVYKLSKMSVKPSALFISPSCLYLVALVGNRAYTYLLPSSTSQLPEGWKAQLIKFVTDHALVCGAFAPNNKLSSATGTKGEEWFATGDEFGVIRLWRGLGQAFSGDRDPSKDTDRRLPTTSLAWHAHAVAAIAFTPSGSQLLSVGEESVLVQWHLGSGKREYVPRLGGRPIVSLAVRQAVKGREEEWWMAFADGSVVKVGAGSGRVENVGHGVKIDPLRQNNTSTPYPLTIHPSTSALVLPSSNPGTLQFIDPSNTSLLFDLEVAPSNRISRRDEREIVPVAVEHVAFSDPVKGKSEWMATIEGREGDEREGGGEVKNLKIWRWDGSRYMVNTQFPRPHGVSDITNLAFSPLNTQTSPSLPYLLTTSIDGSAKIWHVRQSKKSEHGKAASKKAPTFELFWAARSSWTYRSLPINSASFSPDSTIIALGHGSSSLVSLWDAETNVFLQALDSKKDVKDIQHVAFAGETGRYIAAAGIGGLIVWDLFSCQKSMSYPLDKITSLISLPSGDILITDIVTSSTIVSIYSPTSSAPIRTMTVPHVLRSLLPLPSASTNKIGHLNFAAVSRSGDLYRLGDDASSVNIPSGFLKDVGRGPSQPERLSIWQEMFGEHAFLDPSSIAESSTSTRQPTSALPRGNTSSLSIYDGPSHTLPPAHLLFDGFMQEILAGGSISLPEVEEEVPILYEPDNMEGLEEADQVEERRKERIGGIEEMKELEEFFKGLLGAGPKMNGNGKMNGHHVHVPNGHIEEEEEGKSKSIPNGSSTPSKARPLRVEEGDRLVNGDGGVSESGKKGKKRRAPIDLE